MEEEWKKAGYRIDAKESRKRQKKGWEKGVARQKGGR
jgi:hypothetical protein